ncbi:MAG: PstS family phosphate ABC transporter substrate-binding protein [Halapricum sp.]
MTREFDSGVSRRKLLTMAGSASAAAMLAGCGGSGGNGGDGNNGGSTSTLKAGGSSTVYPITNSASNVWQLNPKPSNTEYWPAGKYDIQTDERLANYWAGLYGFEAGGKNPPFDVTVNLSHSGTGLNKLKEGKLDIGDASAPVEAELDGVNYDNFVNHVVGVDAQPIVVSKAVYDAGVKQLDAQTVRDIYKGKIKNWKDVPGYSGSSRQIQAIGRAVGSGTDTSFRKNMLGKADAKMPGVDIRKGENQQVAKAVTNSDNAIAYMALAFVSDKVPAVALNFDGTVYEPGKNLSDEGYPLSRDLHCYTWKETSKKEAAFLRMILNEFGQDQFVKPAGYATLSDSRRKEELDKLPEPSN